MQAFLSLGIGYLMGSVNSAALVGRRKQVDLSPYGLGKLCGEMSIG